jgi:hypothetical protein
MSSPLATTSLSEKVPLAGIVSVTAPHGAITGPCCRFLQDDSKTNNNATYMYIFLTIGHKITTLFADTRKIE